MVLARHRAALIKTIGTNENMKRLDQNFTRVYHEWPLIHKCWDEFLKNGSWKLHDICCMNGEQFFHSTDTSPPWCCPELFACCTNEYNTPIRDLTFLSTTALWHDYFQVICFKIGSSELRITLHHNNSFNCLWNGIIPLSCHPDLHPLAVNWWQHAELRPVLYQNVSQLSITTQILFKRIFQKWLVWISYHFLNQRRTIVPFHWY